MFFDEVAEEGTIFFLILSCLGMSCDPVLIRCIVAVCLSDTCTGICLGVGICLSVEVVRLTMSHHFLLSRKLSGIDEQSLRVPLFLK